jgi:hypothetical protein
MVGGPPVIDVGCLIDAFGPAELGCNGDADPSFLDSEVAETVEKVRI